MSYMGSSRAESGVADPGGEAVDDWLRSLGVTFVTGVPDSEFKVLIGDLESTSGSDFYQVATREDNAIALAAGARLAGRLPLVFMESSGVGNAIDALTSLAQVYEIPMVLLIAWAGYADRDVPHHNAIGRPLEELMEALAIPSIRCVLTRNPRELEPDILRARQLATLSQRPLALLGVPEKFADG